MINIVEILSKIGFDWPVALANTINFLLVFFVLKKFVFPSVKKVVNERQDYISQGIEKAKEADIRLREVDEIAKHKIKEANLQSVKIIKDTEQRAKELERSLQEKAEQKHKELLKQIELNYEKSREESKKAVFEEAEELVKKFIVKAVELNPKDIDEALVKKAVDAVKIET